MHPSVIRGNMEFLCKRELNRDASVPALAEKVMHFVAPLGRWGRNSSQM